MATSPVAVVGESYPSDSGPYSLLEEIGAGVSATVYRALLRRGGGCEEVAVKLVDLENVSSSLEEMAMETHVMRSLCHPHVVPLLASFVADKGGKGHYLWMVMPYVAGGSFLNIMRWAYAEGLEEPQIVCILRDCLKALVYLHKDGKVHRDVKAGNLLVMLDGTVRLADFGVASPLRKDAESWGTANNAKGAGTSANSHADAAGSNLAGQRNTFVGTPCWMAPEVMEQVHGYDTSADIWSFGITALELAHGKAPFSKYPPMKVMLMTLQNPPPGLDSESDKKRFSKALRDLVAECLQKDPSKRPTAAQLLAKPIFQIKGDTPAAAKKAAAAGEERSPACAAASLALAKTILEPLPSLPERMRRMREREGRSMALAEAKRRDSDQGDEPRQPANEPQQGISGWNFDVVGLKAAAAKEAALDPISEVPANAANVPDLIRMGSSGEQSIPQRARKGPEQRGRFALYDNDDAPPLEGESPPRAAMQASKGLIAHTMLSEKQQPPPEAKAKEVKKIGRFHVIEEGPNDVPSGKPALVSSASLKGMDRQTPSRPLSPCSSEADGDFGTGPGDHSAATHALQHSESASHPLRTVSSASLSAAVDNVRATADPFGRDKESVEEENRIVEERIKRSPAIQAMIEMEKHVRRLAEENARLRLRNVALERRLNALENERESREESEAAQAKKTEDDDW